MTANGLTLKTLMFTQLLVNKELSQITNQRTHLHISNTRVTKTFHLLSQDSDPMMANGSTQKMSTFTQLSFKKELLLSGTLMMEFGKTLMALRLPDLDQHGSTLTASDKITIKAQTKLPELSVTPTRSTLDGERMIQKDLQI